MDGGFIPSWLTEVGGGLAGRGGLKPVDHILADETGRLDQQRPAALRSSSEGSPEVA